MWRMAWCLHHCQHHSIGVSIVVPIVIIALYPASVSKHLCHCYYCLKQKHVSVNNYWSNLYVWPMLTISTTVVIVGIIASLSLHLCKHQGIVCQCCLKSGCQLITTFLIMMCYPCTWLEYYLHCCQTMALEIWPPCHCHNLCIIVSITWNKSNCQSIPADQFWCELHRQFHSISCIVSITVSDSWHHCHH